MTLRILHQISLKAHKRITKRNLPLSQSHEIGLLFPIVNQFYHHTPHNQDIKAELPFSTGSNNTQVLRYDELDTATEISTTQTAKIPEYQYYLLSTTSQNPALKIKSTQNQIRTNEFSLLKIDHKSNLKNSMHTNVRSNTSFLTHLRKILTPKCDKINSICQYYSTDDDFSSKSPDNYKDFECPFPLRKIPEDVPPLQRLKEICIPVYVRRCPQKEERTPRADDCYEVKAKKLPRLSPKCCSPVCQPYQKEKPLPRLKRRPVQEPPKICPKKKIPDCPSRADANLKVIKRQLPILTFSNCPQVKTCMHDTKPLRRLAKMKLTDPLRVCPQPETCNPPERADFKLKITKQQLTKIKFDCIPSLPFNPPPNINMSRLKNIEETDPPRPCEPKPEEIVIRCDDVSPTIVPTRLHSMILKEKNNCISTRDYNKKKSNNTVRTDEFNSGKSQRSPN